MTCEPMRPGDWAEVRRIYEEGIATGNATFQGSAPTWEEWDREHLPHRFVVREGGQVLGWAALTPVSGRCVYAGVGEVSVYVAEAARGRGLGSMLLDCLIDASEQAGFWTLQAGIFPENAGSISVHERNGFRLVGRRERVGKLNGRWRDTLLFERRSTTVGV